MNFRKIKNLHSPETSQKSQKKIEANHEIPSFLADPSMMVEEDYKKP